MKEVIAEDYHVGKEKVNIIANWADGNKLFPIEKDKNPFVEKFFLEDKFVVQYSGNMGLGHEFKTILEGVKLLSKQKDMVFQFIGGGAKKNEIEKFVKKHSLKNVMILSYQSYDNLNYSLNMADISLISIKEGIGGLLLPSKFYGIIAVGKPFVLVGDNKNEIYDFIDEFKLGKYVKEGDTNGFYNTIMLYYNNRDILKTEGVRLREKFIELFEREKSIEKYYKLFINVMGK
jgi:glycosyltransferase involved in cell wall biosynthesis